ILGRFDARTPYANAPVVQPCRDEIRCGWRRCPCPSPMRRRARVSVWLAERFARLWCPGGATVTGSDGHAGIYDDFPGYRLPPDDELNEALRAALVVIDANV